MIDSFVWGARPVATWIPRLAGAERDQRFRADRRLFPPGTAAAARLVAAMPIRLLPSASHVPTRSLFVARDGGYFSVSGGRRVDLSTRGPLRRIFRAIVTAHRENPSRALSVVETFDAGWFGERAQPDAAAGRVYSAISKLRRLGLGQVLVRTDAGYRLDPRVCVIEESPLVARREPSTIIQHPVVPARMAS
jgi:hypothetical protein